MIRIIFLVIVLTGLALGLAWFADQPGSLVLNWLGYEIETSFFIASLAVVVVMATVLIVWSVLSHLVMSPAVVYRFFQKRREKRGLQALSSGMIAISAGDRSQATKYASLARKSLPNEPMTALLRAQSAQLSGDRATARRIYSAMLEVPDTELLGLRGLFLEAQQEDETEAARQFAERAMRLNPKLPWSVSALLEIQCKSGDWAGALGTLAVARAQKHFAKKDADRKRAVLLTAQAQEAEDGEMDKALALALEAHKLAVDLSPAAALAGRILASKGNTSQAARVVAKTWRYSPHPDLAVVYAFARPGDSPRDRLKRVRALAQMAPHNMEGPIAVAAAAIETRDWDEARDALNFLLQDQPTQRVCTLMARIEAGEYGDKGRVREWLARGLRAPRDPAWTADGHVSDHWQPISPVTGELDAFAWRVPVEGMEQPAGDGSIEDFLSLGGGTSAALGAPDNESDSTPVAEEVNVSQGVEAIPVQNESAAVDDVVAKEPRVAEPVSDAKQGTVWSKYVAPGDMEKMKPVAQSGDETVAVVTDEVVEPEKENPKTEREAVDLRTRSKPRIFVPPRAPDDPGPDPLDPDEARTPLARYRMPASKGS